MFKFNFAFFLKNIMGLLFLFLTTISAEASQCSESFKKDVSNEKSNATFQQVIEDLTQLNYLKPNRFKKWEESYFSELKKAVENQDPKAQLNLGKMFFIEGEYRSAIELLEQAIQNNNESAKPLLLEAQKNLIFSSLNKKETESIVKDIVQFPNPNEVLEIIKKEHQPLLKTAQEENLNSQSKLAEIFLNEKKYRLAIFFLEKAVVQLSVPAKDQLKIAQKEFIEMLSQKEEKNFKKLISRLMESNPPIEERIKKIKKDHRLLLKDVRKGDAKAKFDLANLFIQEKKYVFASRLLKDAHSQKYARARIQFFGPDGDLLNIKKIIERNFIGPKKPLSDWVEESTENYLASMKQAVAGNVLDQAHLIDVFKGEYKFFRGGEYEPSLRMMLQLKQDSVINQNEYRKFLKDFSAYTRILAFVQNLSRLNRPFAYWKKEWQYRDQEWLQKAEKGSKVALFDLGHVFYLRSEFAPAFHIFDKLSGEEWTPREVSDEKPIRERFTKEKSEESNMLLFEIKKDLLIDKIINRNKFIVMQDLMKPNRPLKNLIKKIQGGKDLLERAKNGDTKSQHELGMKFMEEQEHGLAIIFFEESYNNNNDHSLDYLHKARDKFVNSLLEIRDKPKRIPPRKKVNRIDFKNSSRGSGGSDWPGGGGIGSANPSY